MSANHTPTPWRIGDAGRTIFGPPNGTPSPKTVATLRDKANAEFIVRACNSHDELKAALVDVLETRSLSGSEAWDEARLKAERALAKAGGVK